MQWLRAGMYIKIDNDVVQELIKDMENAGLNVEEV